MAQFNFRHGIARRQQDGSGNPNNLLPTNGGSYLDLIVSPDETVVCIAHYDADYTLTENVSVAKAWGPFSTGIDYWIYWDIDFTTGALSRGFTTYDPDYGATPPPAPAPDKHWFDTTQMVMKVWTGAAWIEKLRVFSAKYRAGASIIYYPLGSHVGSNEKTKAGAILFDPDGRPLQQFQRNGRGRFITTETDLHSQFNRIANFRVESAIVQGEAQEPIAIHHAVAFEDFDQLIIARNSDLNRPAIGVSTEIMNTGEVRSYITKGFITNEVDWDWSGYPAHQNIYVGPNGELLPGPDPSALSQQAIGYIVNRTTVFIDVSPQVEMEPPIETNEVGLLTNRNTGKSIARKIPFFLDDLKDVDINNPQDGDVIRWDSTVNRWVLESNCCGGGGGATTLGDLTDVDLGVGPIPDGFSLTYNDMSGMWEPDPKVTFMDDIADVVSPAPSDGDVLIYRTSSPAGWVSEPATSTDEFVKVSASDTTTGHLNAKLAAGTGIGLTVLNTGGNEQYEIALSGTLSFGLFVTNVTSPVSGLVSDYVYAPGTVPANAVVTEATSDEETVRIHFIVEGDGSFYSPSVIVDVPTGSPLVGDNVIGTLTQDPQDIRTFHGYADITVADGLLTGRTVYLEASHGATAQVLIKRAPIAPEIQTMTFDSIYPTVPADPTSGYPGGTQTTIKSGNLFYVVGTVENSATVVSLNTGGAVWSGTYTTATAGGNLGAPDSGGVGYRTFTIRFTASAASGLQTATAEAQNSFGSTGNPFITTNSVLMDQVTPSVNIVGINYPSIQQALKGSEQAVVNNTVSGQDYIYYYENGGAGYIDIANPNTYEASKSVTRIAGDYVFNGNNFAIKAFKTSNGTSTTVATGDVNISNIAPTVAIVGAATRLISSPTGEDYIITLSFSQQLLQAPTITSSGDAAAGDRGSWSGGGNTWSFTLTVDDADNKGIHNWTVDGVNTLSNNTYNGITITSGGSYTIGGFTYRYVTIGALEQVVDLGVDITDPAKIIVKYRDTADNLTYRGSDLSQFAKGWSAVDGSALVFTPGPEPFPNYSNFVFQDPVSLPTSWFYLTDALFAGANTTGTLQIEIQEVA